MSTPENGLNQLYEVWLRYRIALWAPDGSETLHQSWLHAYGQAPERLGRQHGMQTALERALRDVGAMLVGRWIRAPDTARRLRPAK